jgi:hypothetical protein
MENKRIWVIVLLGVLLTAGSLAYGTPAQKDRGGGASDAGAKPSAQSGIETGGDFKRIILIGWDGVQRNHMKELLGSGRLPNLKKFIDRGLLIDIDITCGATETKPGWAQILTGYCPEKTGVYENRKYAPIPKGYTIQERLEKHFGDENIVTVLLSGKRHNLGARGPHSICTNCTRGTWFKGEEGVPIEGKGERRLAKMKGEPYFLSKDNIDFFENGLGTAEHVGQKLNEYIERSRDGRLFIFVEFREPDQPMGHAKGENSREYSEGIIQDDKELGKTMKRLEELGIHEDTLIYITSDHGFDEGGNEHFNAPHVFLATNDKEVAAKAGDRKDIAPTIMHRFGMDIGSITPPLDGRSLLKNAGQAKGGKKVN